MPGTLVRVAVAGSSGHGKSTLVARLQFASGQVPISVSDLAPLDQFGALVTTAAAADAAVVAVDATSGLTAQTRRDIAVLALLRVPSLVLVVNKMDEVGYERASFDAIARDFRSVAAALGVDDVRAVPVAALPGDNVSTPSAHLAWYSRGPLIDQLASIVPADASQHPARFPVQVVIRPRTAEHPDYRGYAGRVEAGSLRPGDTVRALPSGWLSRIAGIDTPSGSLEVAGPGRSVTVRLVDELDVPRGDVLVADRDPRPEVRRDLDLTLFWMADRTLRPGDRFRLRHTTRDVLSVVGAVASRFDTDALRFVDASELSRDDIGTISLRLADAVVVDRYSASRRTGAVVLIDESTGVTVAAGLVR